MHLFRAPLGCCWARMGGWTNGWMDELGEGRRPSAAHPFFLPDEFLSVGAVCVTEISRSSPSVIVRRGGGGGGARCFVLQPQEKEGRREMKMKKEKNPPTGSFSCRGAGRCWRRVYIYIFFLYIFLWRDTLTRSKHVVPYSQGIQTHLFFI